MGFNDKVDAMLGGSDRAKVKRNGIVVLALVLVDCACVVLMREAPSLDPHRGWTCRRRSGPPRRCSALPEFADDTVDCLVYSCSASSWSPSWQWQLCGLAAQPERHQEEPQRTRRVRSVPSEGAAEPLLITGGGAADPSSEAAGRVPAKAAPATQ